MILLYYIILFFSFFFFIDKITLIISSLSYLKPNQLFEVIMWPLNLPLPCSSEMNVILYITEFYLHSMFVNLFLFLFIFLFSFEKKKWEEHLIDTLTCIRTVLDPFVNNKLSNTNNVIIKSDAIILFPLVSFLFFNLMDTNTSWIESSVSLQEVEHSIDVPLYRRELLSTDQMIDRLVRKKIDPIFDEICRKHGMSLTDEIRSSNETYKSCYDREARFLLQFYKRPNTSISLDIIRFNKSIYSDSPIKLFSDVYVPTNKTFISTYIEIIKKEKSYFNFSMLKGSFTFLLISFLYLL